MKIYNLSYQARNLVSDFNGDDSSLRKFIVAMLFKTKFDAIYFISHHTMIIKYEDPSPHFELNRTIKMLETGLDKLCDFTITEVNTNPQGEFYSYPLKKKEITSDDYDDYIWNSEVSGKKVPSY